MACRAYGYLMRVNLDAMSGSASPPRAMAVWADAVARGWSDPQRAHAEGRAARALLDDSREQVATALGARADEIAFTSSLSQAHRRAVVGFAIGRMRSSTRVVSSAVEHSALLHACAALADGWRTPTTSAWDHTIVGVQPDGAVNAAEFVTAVNGAPTAFAVLQAANSEVGTLQPLADVAQQLASGTPLLVDGTALLGETGFGETPWDVLTASAAHLGAPAACAVLAVRAGTRWRSPDRPTDGYEHGWVPGQPDIATIAAYAAALTESVADVERSRRLSALTTQIRDAVPNLISDCVVVGAPHHRTSHIVTMSFLYVSGAALAAELDDAGFAVASGSACASDVLAPSHVLAAMGALTEGNIRVSLPWHITQADVDSFLNALPGCVARVRAKFGAPT